MNRSPFFYVGDKYRLMPQLKKHFPKNINRLVEPFVGGGSVFLNTNAQKYLANDLNHRMIDLHEFMQSYKNNRNSFFKELETIITNYNLSASYLGKTVPDTLKQQYKKTYYAVYNKKSYLELRDDYNSDKNNLMKLYVLLLYGFNHMIRFNRSGEFNIPVGNVDYNKNVVKALNCYFDFIENNEINFTSLDFSDFFNKNIFDKNDFIYLDPPYLISASEYNKGWDLDSEKKLLDIIDDLDKKGIKFALSNVLIHKGMRNTLLIEWAKKYNIINIKSNYISYHDNSIKETVEVLITNY